MTDKAEPALMLRMAEIAEAAAERAVAKTLLTIGIDVRDPLQAQRDFALMREVGAFAASAEFRKDIEHTRRWRKAIEAIQSKGIAAAVGLIVTGTAAALWIGLQDMFAKR